MKKWSLRKILGTNYNDEKMILLVFFFALTDQNYLTRANKRIKRWSGYKHQMRVPFYFDETHNPDEKAKIRRTIGQLNNWIDCAFIFEVDKRYGVDESSNEMKRSSQSAMRIAKPPVATTSCSSSFLRGHQNLLLGADCLKRGGTHALQRQIMRSLNSRMRLMSS